MEMLCRVLLVEDEYLMQQGIKYLVDWEHEGFEIVGSALNGQEALDLVEKLHPHIVLTDVVMPIMNGVELTRILRAKYPEIQVVVVSSYSDFEYVRDSFQGGAVDYILKPTLSPQILLDTMHRTAKRIFGLSLHRQEGAPEICLGRMVAGFQSDDTAKVLHDYFHHKYFLLLGERLGHIFAGNKAMQEQHTELLKSMAKKVLVPFSYLIVTTEEGVLLLVLNFPPDNKQTALAAVTQMVEQIAQSEPKTFFVASDVFTDLAQIREIYQGPFLKNTENTFFYRDTHFLHKPALKNTSTPPKLNTSLLNQMLSDSRITDAMCLLRKFVEEAYKAHMPAELELKSVVQNALYQIIARLEELGLNADNLAHLKRACLTQLQACNWAEEFMDTVNSIYSDLDAVLSTYDLDVKSDIMQSFLAFIDAHYAEPITLQDLAKKFNFNYSYVSTYFHCYHEDGFNDYLNRVRIQQASVLLQKSNTVSQVCGMVGYSGQSYFTKVFKKYTGCTPGEYQRRNKRGG